MGIRVNFSTEEPLPSGDNGDPVVPKEGKAWEFQSKSREGLLHFVTITNGHINCTCEGWRGHRKCWHTKEVLEKLHSDEL